MNATPTHRSTCRLCDSTRVEIVVELAPIPLAEKYVTADQLSAEPELYPIDLYMCRNCGHVQILDVIDPDYLWKDYTYQSGQTKDIVDHFESIADKVVSRFQPKPGGLVVDIGSNDGSLLRPFQSRGLRVLGIDPAREIALKATASGIETLPELMTFERAQQIRKERGPASIVTAFNVFAHADDMAGMAESVREMLASNGVFVFEVRYLLDIIDHMLLGNIVHEHLCHHSVKPLVKFLKRHGLELIDVERVGIERGLVVTVQKAGGPYPVAPSVGQMLALETQRQLDQPQTLRAFSTRLRVLKRQAQTLIADWKQQGKTVAGYGAARSGPTLIAQLGLEGAIQYVLDDDPQKVGKYTPGHHIPVVAAAELDKRMPDYTILLAWTHAERIIADHRDYLERGGHFVNCCPEIQIVSATGRMASTHAA